MKKIIFLIFLIFVANATWGQENVAPIRYNAQLHKKPGHRLAARTSSAIPLSLPFFEDFTQYWIYPDSNKWVDFQVYINNTMAASPPSWGVATFDDLDFNGIPYDSFSNTDFRYADSLTSQPIDLSSNSPGDSVYLSFSYQPQGNGFYPLPQDSLMLFIRTTYGGFVKVWSTPGTTLQPFQTVMIPIVDSIYFYNAFQFRFVNIAALYWADAVWNVDYIRLDKNRSISDTAINDVAFTTNPTFLLNDYTYMPWSQYIANPFSETVSQVNDSINNSSFVAQNVNYYFTSKDVTGGASTPLFTAGTVPLVLPGYQTRQSPESFSIPTLPSYPAETKVDFECKYYFGQTSTTGPTNNDTIVKHQVFDNYLAYDDGTAEKSYYLNLFTTLPGSIAVEYHLNHPDTMRGMAIYFGRQIPFATNKVFSINVYNSLAGVNGAGRDSVIYTTDFVLNPGYADTTNHFWYYRFDTPLLLPAGTFYAGTEQCAECGSDSIYIGLDVNRIGSNHAYYNVLGSWSPSLVSGALMMRPLFGQPIAASGIKQIAAAKGNWLVSPNPAINNLLFEFDGNAPATYHITDIMGHSLLTGTVLSGKTIDISGLVPGLYFVNLISANVSGTKKIIKL